MLEVAIGGLIYMFQFNVHNNRWLVWWRYDTWYGVIKNYNTGGLRAWATGAFLIGVLSLKYKHVPGCRARKVFSITCICYGRTYILVNIYKKKTMCTELLYGSLVYTGHRMRQYWNHQIYSQVANRINKILFT